MKNTKNLSDDGSRWSLLTGDPSEAIFKSWGATKVWWTPMEMRGDRTGKMGMILLDDGWHYCHETDGRSCWAARESYQCPTAETAWLAFEMDLARRNVKSAERSLSDAIDAERKAQDAYARAIVKAFSK